MLQITNLNAGYGGLHVLQGISLNVNPGEMVALIGPNGAGKSTVLKAVFNLCSISQGTISFGKKDISNLPAHKTIEQGIFYVNQGKVNFNALTVRENLIIGFGKKSIEERLTYVYNLFPILKKREHQAAFGLSGGERQMLAVGASRLLDRGMVHRH